MAIAEFKLPIGAKRQVTIPREFMSLLSLKEGQELLLQVEEGHATLKPMVSILREELPEELRERFAARRGKKPTDIPLSEFMKKLDRRGKTKGTVETAVAAPRAAGLRRRS